MKSFRTGLFGGLALGVSGALSLGVALPASADTYHAVTNGETLAAIAKRYNVKTDALREANKLSNLGDNSPLAAMLLRIPTAGETAQASGAKTQTATPAPRPAGSFQQQIVSQSPARYFGTVTRNVPYVVQNGDSFESIAARFSKNNESVSVAEIRSRNNLSALPRAGTTIQLPVKTSYGVSQASAQIQPRAATQRAIVPDNGDSAAISVVSTSATGEPVARVITADAAPVYRAPNAPRGQLAARGGYGSMVDGARVLQNGEELMSAPRNNTRSSSLPATHNLARVAKISQNGARIRRLPDADAVTLYNCKTGTEIAVIKQQGAWSAVLMSDRSTGWIPTRYLSFTGASVDITSQVETRDRGDDTATGWTAGYQSNHPAIRYALSWLGTPYVYGGNSKRGIDCSALMQRAFAAGGKKLPRVSRDQAKVGMKVSPENLQPGDRLYFSASGTHVDHTGLYMGNGLYVHASGGARKVVVSRLREPRSWNIFVGARR